jgi:16S rRNA (cytosine967-C5)-methyltransferase
MKLHSHLVFKIVEVLDLVFLEKRYADKVLEKTFKANKKLGSRDRKFFAETVYEVIRHYRFYSEVMKSDLSLDLVVAHLVKTRGNLPGEPEFNDFDVEKIQSRLKYKYPIEILNSFPDWIHQLGEAEFKTEWPELMKALNIQAEVFLRTNTLRTTKKELQAALLKEEIQTKSVEGFEDCIALVERKNVFTTECFKKGFFEVQDAASQKIAALLDPQAGDRVVDACAGAGGKSLHLAARMKNKGKIISMDIHEWKLGELKKRAARGGVDIIETKVIETNKTIKRLENSFDKILLDVPCSGMGVIRRNPDTKWKLSQEEIDRMVILQREIIRDYSKMAKPKATMVYATCSILHRENEEQVKWFLSETEEGKTWKLVEEMRLWPHKDGFDGFYAAKLERAIY